MEGDFSNELYRKLEEIKEVRRQVAEEYMRTGNINNEKFNRIAVLMKQASDFVFERFPVIFLHRQGYILPMPANVAGLRHFLNQGYELIVPVSLEGKSIEELVEIQKENLDRLIPYGQLFAVDAEFYFYLESHLKGTGESYVKDELLAKSDIDIEKKAETFENEEQVSANVSGRKRRKRGSDL